jgi:hypothetical protein
MGLVGDAKDGADRDRDPIRAMPYWRRRKRRQPFIDLFLLKISKLGDCQKKNWNMMKDTSEIIIQ